MSFDIFEKDFHILQEISFCPVGPLIDIICVCHKFNRNLNICGILCYVSGDIFLSARFGICHLCCFLLGSW